MAERIDGWKAIGAYFGRDRTTAIRWANSRALPVHRMPGGKRATVYALRSELDVWLSSQRDIDREESEVAVPAAPARRGGRIWWLVGGALALLVFLSAAMVLRPVAPAAATLPASPELARIYLKAREDWALRTPASLDRATRGFQEIAARAPDFAPAFVGLADAYLLAREFGTLGDEKAFEEARRAAARALALDPDLDDAHRAMGFVLYWWDHDHAAAGRAFREARRLAPQDAQTHFWYGNILIDNGDQAPAMREYDIARTIEPGSIAIRADLAWATWSAGRRDEAMAMLDALAISNPAFAGIHESRAIIHLADGDLAAYATAIGRLADLRDDAVRRGHAETLARTIETTPEKAADLLWGWTVADIRANPRRNHGWPAFVASAIGDRDRLLAMLTDADRRKERWGDAGFVFSIRKRWHDDAAILTLLDRRKQPPIE